MLNKLNRNVPDNAKGFVSSDDYKNFERKLIPTKKQGNAVLVSSLEEAIAKANLKSGMTISFHHHLRNGDYVLNMVCELIEKMELVDIKVAASSVFPTHSILSRLIEKGIVTQIFTNYINGSVADTITSGKMKYPLIMNTHGGRARSIESGELHIDVAFVAVPTVDRKGNGSGAIGKSACGAIGYAIPDVMYSDKVVVITDNLIDKLDVVDIEGKYVDYIVAVDSIGDAKGIVSGTTKVTTDPVGLKIARDCAKLLNELGFVKNGLSMQTGAGGTSLAVADKVKQIMVDNSIKGSFASGGITSYFVDMLNEGLLEKLYDVQCFDLDAVKSISSNPLHTKMSSSKYGNPYETDVVVNNLDFVILGATEIDLDFNVNVTTASDGRLIGGSGGHSDTAYGAKLTVITTALTKSRLSIIRDKVTTITTPGSDVDVLVTERGIAINPLRKDLLAKLKDTKLNIVPIEQLYKKAVEINGEPNKIMFSDNAVGYVMYRDGSIIDTIYQRKN